MLSLKHARTIFLSNVRSYSDEKLMTAMAKEFEKKRRADAAIIRNVVKKSLFGRAETQKEKRERLKKEQAAETGGKPVRRKFLNETELEWMNNFLLKDTYKIYRKLKSGRYKEVDKEKLVDFIRAESIAKIDLPNELRVPVATSVTEENPTEERREEKMKPKIQVPEIIIRHMTKFPMVQSVEEKLELGSNIGDDEALSNMFNMPYPSVTTILNQTMPLSARIALEKWKAKMIAELGEEKFQIMNKETLNKGARLHSCIRQYLETKEVRLDETVEGGWRSVEKILENVTDVKILERPISHPKLYYKGITDCVASYKGVPHVIEWKRADKLKSNLSQTYDAPVQVCAYMGALPYVQKFDPPIVNGLVVVAYTDGSPASVFELKQDSCYSYWQKWLERVQSYWMLQLKSKSNSSSGKSGPSPEQVS